MPLTSRARTIAIVFWVLAFLTIPVWTRMDIPGYDIAIYQNAVTSLKAGHDPYVDAMAVQDAFHRTLAQHPNASPPYSYVYAPVTLPLLRLIGALPVWFSYTLYWLLIIAGVFAVLWVTTHARQSTDRIFIMLVAPLAAFCPGMLAHDTLLSGNVAFIFYGLVFLGAYCGWRYGIWRWCYLAILIASCFKPPLLTLLAIPFFSARRQWLPTGATAALGLGIFAAQSRLCPSLFAHFMRAVQLQFTYNHDFGSSPAGIFSNFLVNHGIPYSPASIVFYLLYAAAICTLLLHLSREYFDGRLTLQQWMPVLLVGAILLNPRIMEYDAAPLAIPMGLIGWRFFTRDGITPRAVLTYFAVFLTANIIGVHFDGAWKPIECLLLISSFSAGTWNLLQHAEATFPVHAEEPSDVPEELVPA